MPASRRSSGPEKPPAPPRPPAADPAGDCDGDGQRNAVDGDDDNDLLTDGFEKQLRIDQCKADSDGDGVTDGYEYQSARDLNDDEYQWPQAILPAPVKRPYPNPLFADAEVDYDGDSLRLGQEYALWAAYRNPAAGLNDLVYSDGNQYSAYGRNGNGHRPGPLAGPDPEAKYRAFFGWADAAGYRRRGGCATFDAPESTASSRTRRATTTSTSTASCPTTSATRTPTASRTTTRPPAATRRVTGPPATRARSRTRSPTRAPTSSIPTATATPCAMAPTTRTTTTSRT